MTEICIALISAGIPALVTLITSNNQKKLSKMQSARSSILILILEDRIRMMSHQIPVNYQAIMYEFDEYKKDKGNSYIKEKVDEYISFVKKFEKTNNMI